MCVTSTVCVCLCVGRRFKWQQSWQTTWPACILWTEGLWWFCYGSWGHWSVKCRWNSDWSCKVHVTAAKHITKLFHTLLTQHTSASHTGCGKNISLLCVQPMAQLSWLLLTDSLYWVRCILVCSTVVQGVAKLLILYSLICSSTSWWGVVFRFFIL